MSTDQAADRTMGRTGAETLMATAVDCGVSVCFANPGTTEMPIVAALDRIPGVRAVLGLHENVCTGAADGYARVSGEAAMTLLHLGPGLANGLANLHNARRADSPIVNVVGDHATWHLPFDAPLTSDIGALARTVGGHHEVHSRSAVAATTRRAIDEARQRPGVSTLVVPADIQGQIGSDNGLTTRAAGARTGSGQLPGVDRIAGMLRAAGSRAVLLLGGDALSRSGQLAAGRIAAATGAGLFSETFPARAERGGGLPSIDRLAYFPEQAIDLLRHATLVVLAGAREPVAYFGYEGIPSRLAPADTVESLVRAGDDVAPALAALADLVAGPDQASVVEQPPVEPGADATLTGRTVGAALACWLPEDAIVSVEGGTCGYPFYTASAGAVAHTVMTNTGGAIGQGLPVALGAAIAAPDRPVIALQSDGSGLYTAQALWTMARESARVIVLMAVNHRYQVLRTELARHGADALGPQAAQLTSLGDPAIDWQSLARGLGVPAAAVTTVGELRRAFAGALATAGPYLIQLTM